MAVESPYVWDESFKALVDFSTTGGAGYGNRQFCFVCMSSGEGSVALCTGSSGGSGGAIGVLQNAPTSGHAATVRILGKTKIYTSAAVAIGAHITASTEGAAVTAASTGQYAFGMAVSTSTAAGQLVEVLLTGRYPWAVGSSA